MIHIFLFPLINILPPLYSPSLEPHMIWKVSVGGAFLLVGLTYLFSSTKKHPAVSFCLIWFFVSYIPVSNIVPLLNPMAHRFLYIPSVGLMVVLGVLIENFCLKLTRSNKLPSLPLIIKMTILGLCMAITIPLNSVWNSTASIAKRLIVDYPNDPKGFSVLGMELFYTGEIQEAKVKFQKAIDNGSTDLRDYYHLNKILLMEKNKK